MIIRNDNNFQNHNDMVNKWKYSFKKRLKIYLKDVICHFQMRSVVKAIHDKKSCSKYSFQMETDALYFLKRYTIFVGGKWKRSLKIMKFLVILFSSLTKSYARKNIFITASLLIN